MTTSSARKAAAFRIAVVVSRYNASITTPLLEGAFRAYESESGTDGGLTVIDAPGSFELPVLCALAARSGRFDGVLALGCLIKGDTSHDRVIADAVAQGLVNVSIATGVPACFGVLTVDTAAQARARAGGDKGNKGEESMTALLQTIRAARALRSGRRASIGGPRPDKSRTPPARKPPRA